MNAGKCGWLFLCMRIVEFSVLLLMILFSGRINMGITTSLLLNQLMILVPALLFLLGTRERIVSFIVLKKPHLITSLLVIVLTSLCMPLIATVNVLSQLFVDNEVAQLGSYLADIPAWQIILLIGFVGPVIEEFVFRGVFYQGLRRSGRVIGAILLSAVVFGLAHMNFNQMSYAIVVGIVLALLVEGCGSIFYSMLAHIWINTTNAVQMVFSSPQTAESLQESKALVEQTMHMPYKQALCVIASVMAVISVFTTALAACLFWAIVKKEGRTEHVRALFRAKGDTEERGRLMSFPLLLGMALCLIYMTADVVLQRM